MWRHQKVVLVTLIGVSLSAATAVAQQPGTMRPMGGGMMGMMGMTHDSATMALMAGSHQLVMSHDRITRTVTKLPNGVRTVTESDDPQVAALIREHVRISVSRVERRDDPGLPMESPALHSLFTNGDKVRTTTDTTARGVIVVQTSDDSLTVAALHKHAAEVSELVEGGMAAMHEAMMRNGGMRMGPGMGRRGPPSSP